MRVPWMVAGLGVATLCGCGSVTHDDLIKQQIRSIEQAATILEGIKDAASGLAARPRLLKVVQEMEAQNARARKLAPADREQLRELASKNQQASQAALDRLNAAARNAAAVPDCADVVAEFNRALNRLPH